MSAAIPLEEATRRLPQLLDRALAGEEVLIGTSGGASVRLVPTTAARRAGLLAGRIRIAEDFDAPLPDSVLARFAGSER